MAYCELRPNRHNKLSLFLIFFRLLLDLDRWVEFFLAILNDGHLSATGGFIKLFTHRLFINDVNELHHTLHIRNNRLCVGVPAEQ